MRWNIVQLVPTFAVILQSVLRLDAGRLCDGIFSPPPGDTCLAPGGEPFTQIHCFTFLNLKSFESILICLPSNKHFTLFYCSTRPNLSCTRCWRLVCLQTALTWSPRRRWEQSIIMNTDHGSKWLNNWSHPEGGGINQCSGWHEHKFKHRIK